MVANALAGAGHPEVTLIRGADSHHFLFDNAATRQGGERHVLAITIARRSQFDAVPVDRLVVEGSDFAKWFKAAEVRADRP